MNPLNYNKTVECPYIYIYLIKICHMSKSNVIYSSCFLFLSFWSRLLIFDKIHYGYQECTQNIIFTITLVPI